MTVKEVDEFGQERSVPIRICDGQGRLMVDRVIKELSHRSKGDVKISPSLRSEIFHDYGDQLYEGVKIVSMAHDEQMEKEFNDAVYGVNNSEGEPYRTFAKSRMEHAADQVTGNEYSPEKELNFWNELSGTDGGQSASMLLLVQVLKARRRIFHFNKRNQAQEENAC